MSREIRTVRPFRVARRLERLFSSAVFRFGERVCAADARIVVDQPDIYTLSRAELHWTSKCRFEAFKRELQVGVAEQAIDPSALSFFVTVTTPFLRITDVVYSVPLDDLDVLDRVVIFSEPVPSALRAPHHGAVVDAYLLLTEAVTRRPLSPWRQGTWLARAQFKIATKQTQRLFRPKPLDEEKRKELGLSPRTMRYVRMGDHDVLERYSDSEPPELYVDRQLLEELSAGVSHGAAETMQLQLAHDFMAAVVLAAAQRPRELSNRSLEDLEDSLLGRILEIAARSGASRDELLADLRNDPPRVVACLDAALDIVAPARKALRNVEDR